MTDEIETRLPDPISAEPAPRHKSNENGLLQ